MSDVIGLNDVSSKDVGRGSQLKTGGKRSYNMPKACVNRLIKQGKSPEEAHKLCYPKKAKDDSPAQKGSAKPSMALRPQQGYKELEYKSKLKKRRG
tara:strand:- start:629 stop:916 length:288 start_codon:yes stop_codon:yes gene_type:complete